MLVYCIAPSVYLRQSRSISGGLCGTQQVKGLLVSGVWGSPKPNWDAGVVPVISAAYMMAKAYAMCVCVCP